MIQPIDAWSVEQIKSGQVIVSIASAVKELVENSIDSGATVVTIKINDYGLGGFFVEDNGSGIDSADFDVVAQKHTTSKIASFADLDRVDTLGFRGEALSSICAVSQVTITTSTGRNGPSGTTLTLDHNGAVVSQKKVPCRKGTIVTVSELFANIPVRRKDFERNCKRYYEALVQMVQTYAIITPATLVLEHTTKEKKRVPVLRSQGNELHQRVACIYGPSTAASLVPVEFSGYNMTCSGLMSKPNAHSIRQSANRQLLYINGRPTDQKRISKAILETYKQFDGSSALFYILDLHIPTSSVDINVSPDKREILIHHETRLVEGIRSGLASNLAKYGHSVPREPDVPAKRAKQSLLSLEKFSGSGGLINQSSKKSKDLESQEESEQSVEEEAGDDPSEREEEESNSDVEVPPPPTAGQLDRREQSDATVRRSQRLTNEQDTTVVAVGSVIDTRAEDVASHIKTQTQKHLEQGDKASVSADVIRKANKESANIPASSKEAEMPNSPSDTPGISSTPDVDEALSFTPVAELLEDSIVRSAPVEHDDAYGHDKPRENFVQEFTNSPKVDVNSPLDASQRSAPSVLNAEIAVKTTLAEIKAEHESLRIPQKPRIRNLAIDEEDAEKRLTLTIQKEDFRLMDIVGQFNLGFIVVSKRNKQTHKTDIFVVDQHASDEIYNFERLQRETELSRQTLVVPQMLELSPVEELVVIDNLDVFESNGFTISVNNDAAPGRQCQLVAVPYSKSTVFDENDVHELIYQVQENSNNKNLKCSKLRSMFAMRACRSSIMIGRPLSGKLMKKVVENLGTLSRPWNCPHGRPTLRHVTTLI